MRPPRRDWVSAESTEHPHKLAPGQAPLIDNEGRCLVCAIEGFTAAYDKQAQLLSVLLHEIDPYSAEMSDTPDSRVARAGSIVGNWRRMATAGGPYSLTQWTEDVQHADPCDCDEDDETVGERCMVNSEWTYAVVVDGGAFAPQLVLTLPRTPPEQPDNGGAPMVAVYGPYPSDNGACCDYRYHSPGPCACDEHEHSALHPFGG